MIAEFTNTVEELILHWGISKKNFGEWNSPDDRYMPKESTKFKDGKAFQTKFIKDRKKITYRSIHI